MKDMHYVLENFFTHKDFLAPAAEIPGTMFTPLHIFFALFFFTLIGVSARFVSRRRQLLKPVLAAVWIIMCFWEFAIVYWDSTAGKTVGFDAMTNLSLYPCSLYLYTMPFVLWGKGKAKQACCGYICTLGLLGASVNLLIPMTRLYSYSCISFAGLHTLCFHGAMFFTFLVLILSGYHSYDCAGSWQDLMLPSVPSLLLSIPANLVNYTIGSDYMFFRGKFPVVAKVFGNTRPCIITMVLYLLYIAVPALFYIHGFIQYRKEEKEEDLLLLAAEYI